MSSDNAHHADVRPLSVSTLRCALAITRTAPSFLGHIFTLGIRTGCQPTLSWLGLSLLLHTLPVWRLVHSISKTGTADLWLALTNCPLLLCQLAADSKQYAALLMHPWWPGCLGKAAPCDGSGDNPTGGQGPTYTGGRRDGPRFLQDTDANAATNSGRPNGKGKARREDHDVAEAADDPGTYDAEQRGRFQCIWHHVEGHVHNIHCAKPVEFVSMLK